MPACHCIGSVVLATYALRDLCTRTFFPQSFNHYVPEQHFSSDDFGLAASNGLQDTRGTGKLIGWHGWSGPNLSEVMVGVGLWTDWQRRGEYLGLLLSQRITIEYPEASAMIYAANKATKVLSKMVRSVRGWNLIGISGPLLGWSWQRGDHCFPHKDSSPWPQMSRRRCR